MIFFDTETTGLTLPDTDNVAAQPRIIEIGAISATLMIEGTSFMTRQFSQLINPGVPIPEEVTKITGLTDADVANAPTFIEALPEFIQFVRLDDDNCVAGHNLSFDLWMLIFELRRTGWEHRFPYWQRQVDTCSELANGQSLKKWAAALGVTQPQEHRALSDCILLRDCWEAYHELERKSAEAL